MLKIVVWVFCIALGTPLFAQRSKSKTEPVPDRTYWVDILYRLSSPILSNMSKGELKKNMVLELSPTWDNRNKEVAYLEAFGRLMARC